MSASAIGSGGSSYFGGSPSNAIPNNLMSWGGSVNPYSADVDALQQKVNAGLGTSSSGSLVGNNLVAINKTMSEASKVFQDAKNPPAEPKKKHWWNPLTWFS